MDDYKIKLIEDANNKIFNNLTNIHNKIIFVYSQPKVGSTSLVSSIRISAPNDFNVVHFHDDSTLKNLLGIKNVTIDEIILYNQKMGKKVYVIDVFRTPIERKMSLFFEDIGSFHFNNLEEDINNYNVNRVIKRFNDIYPFIANVDNYLDNYNIPYVNFNFNEKCICQNINNVTYIKLRLKDSNLWGDILTKILGREIVIVKDYQTNNKKIAKLYNDFKNNYKLPRNYFDDLESCRLLNFFYSEKEKKEYINNWSLKITDAYIPFNNEQYDIYMKISLENQIRNFIQLEHYIDNGCLCKYCSNKRKELFIKAKAGESINEKIIHNEVLNSHIDGIKQNIIKKLINAKNEKQKIFKTENIAPKIYKKNLMSKLDANVMSSIIKYK
jgi:hypothetical protein